MRSNAVAGVGAIAFGVLTFVAFVVASPAGGTYKAGDVADYVAKGHRVAVIVAMYLFMLGIAGLVCLLARLREGVAAPAGPIFWGAGIAAAAVFTAGIGIVAAPPLSRMYGGNGTAIGTNVAYTIAEAGNVLIFGVGTILLGFALLALVAAWPATLPGWLRWATLLGAIGALAAPAFFPFFLVLIWAIVTGIWLLVANRNTAPAAAGA